MALSISFLSPILRVPVAFLTMKIASLIFLPERRFLAVTFFQSRTLPNLSLGSSSLISLRRQCFSVSRPRFRPPGNIHSRSLLRRTNRTLPRLTATSLEDFAIRPIQSDSVQLSLRLEAYSITPCCWQAFAGNAPQFEIRGAQREPWDHIGHPLENSDTTGYLGDGPPTV
jgi:hypothetical protein